MSRRAYWAAEVEKLQSRVAELERDNADLGTQVNHNADLHQRAEARVRELEHQRDRLLERLAGRA